MLFKPFHIPFLRKAKKVISNFSVTEKIIFLLVAGIFIVSSVSLAWQVNSSFLEKIPTKGGSFIEGIVGTPRFINPVLAVSEADRDLSILIYSGLMRLSEDGNLIPDLAESYNISEDGLEYFFKLKDGVTFHDGKPVTVEDIAFTINQIQDPLMKSPLQGTWEGVEVLVHNEREISFILKKPYEPFIENTTLGILPKHIWKNASPEQFTLSPYNIEPIGSGPYEIKNVKTNDVRIPVSYILQSFDNFALGEPYISEITIDLYGNEEVLVNDFLAGKINSMHSISPEIIDKLPEDTPIKTSTLPRVFGIFFNQNRSPVLANIEVRKALDVAIDKKSLVGSVLSGYGEALSGPVPQSLLIESTTTPETIGSLAEARDILERNGWEKNEDGVYEKDNEKLEFSLATTNVEDLRKTAEEVVEIWRKLGAKVDIDFFEIGDLKQNVIRSRDYSSLLFGITLRRNLDFYPFWHSSQRIDPGLNISLYTNITVDNLIEESRQKLDRPEREILNKKIAEEIGQEIPAVFLYSPDFIYVVPEKIKNLSLNLINTAPERFSSIHNWYIETEKVWKIFTN